MGEIADLFVNDLLVGVAGGSIRSGVIGEIAITDGLARGKVLDRQEWKVLRAGAKAHRRTGTALYVHSDNDWRRPCRNGALRLAVLEFLREEEWVDLNRIVVCHCSPVEDNERLHHTIIEMGAYVGIDSWGSDVSCPGIPEADYLAYTLALKRLARDEAYAQRILLSQDVCVPRNLTVHGGCGYAHLLRDVVPRFLGACPTLPFVTRRRRGRQMRGHLSACPRSGRRACPHRQAGPEKPDAYSLEYGEDLSGPKTKQVPVPRLPQ